MMEDNEEVEDNDKDDNNFKDISALGLDRDLGFSRGHQGHVRTSMTSGTIDTMKM